MHRLRSIGIFSFAKVMGVMGIVMGLLVCIPYALMFLLFGVAGGVSGEDGAAGLAAMGVFGAVLVVIAGPLLYGFASFIFGLLYALLINLVLGLSGGLELELDVRKA